jgi:WD40 repeat protein/predicted Ser/Thr protein kinase
MPEPSPEAVEALFHEVADLDPERRSVVLDERCAGDSALRAAVEEMLHFDAKAQSATDFLHSPASEARAALPTPAAVPAAIGRYRVVRRLGEGGMGTVYEAEQDDPPRTVALKVMRLGFDSPEHRKRFAQEARILGRLHHSGIAQVYDAGAAEDGRLYFAMEFIRGLPLGEHVRRRGLTAPARLELIARVCDAVQHAHEQGVIHRDLKPANILVEETGQPKVLDFGVAHAAGGGLSGTTAHTRTGQMLGTLAYMSPEQVAGDSRAIDTRSDVYALGVILYELLADRLPYQIENLPLSEAIRVVQEVEPSRLGSIDMRFRGDVETIVGKALAKDKARRYAPVGELAADIRRHLGNQPIRARPPSALYQLRKFTRRHKALVVGVLAVFAALLAGTVVSVLFAWRAADNAAVAQDREREATDEAYRARLAAAVAALSNNDVADAARQLDAAPKALRGWEWHHLHSRLDDSSAVIRLPAGKIGFLLAAADQFRIGAITPAGLRLMDLKGDEVRTLPLGAGHGPLAYQTRHGLRFAVWTEKKAFDLLDEAGQVICRVELPPVPLVVSPDGTRLAWMRADGAVVVHSATTGKQTAVCDGHKGGIFAFTFSPDGTRLASGGEDKMARLWDAATGALLATCLGHTSKVLGVAFSPDGTRLVTTSSDATVRQWDAATGAQAGVPYERHSGEVICAAYSQDGQWIASAGTDRSVRVWRPMDRQDAAVLQGHTGAVSQVAFAPGGRRLASLSGMASFIAESDGTVRVWDVDPGATLPVLHGHTKYVYPVAFSPDGRWIASGDWDGKARLWDAATGEPAAVLPHSGYVLSLAFSPDSRWLVTGSFGEDRLRVWDVATGCVNKEVPGPGQNFRCLNVSPDGKRVAAWADNVPLCVRDLTTGERLFSAEGRPLAYSPDGKWLAGKDADGITVVLWDAHTFGPVAYLREHTGEINAVAFDRAGGRLVSASSDRTVRLWDAATGECLRVFEGHTDEVFTAVFHPDGTRIASAGRDRAVWLWDVASGQEVAHLPGHTSYIWSLAWSPDGKTLVSGSGDSTVRLWGTEPLRVRYQARREAAALRPEAERLVEKLWRQKNDPAAVVQALRADGALSEPLRQAALREVLRQAQPPTDVPGKRPNPP